MNKYIILLFLFGCASKLRISHIRDFKNTKITYTIKYPSFKGSTKEQAKNKRKDFLEKGVANIYASIFRLGAYGKSSFEPSRYQGLFSQYMPFKYISSSPINISYPNEYENASIGAIATNQVSGGNPIIYPIAKKEKEEYMITSKELKNKIDSHVLIISKNDLKKSLDRFHNNHAVVNSKAILNDFLRRYAYDYVSYQSPIKTLYKGLFTQHKNFQHGGGISDERASLKNSLNFSLESEKNRQFIWGLMILLSTRLEAKRLDHENLQLIVNVPLKAILGQYSIQPLKKYIEQ